MSTTDIFQLFKSMVEASGNTILIFVLTLLFGLPLGLIISIGRMSKYKVVHIPIKVYLLIMRGTPLILQLLVVFFVPPLVFGIRVDRFSAAVIAFTLNYAAYFGEIFRSGFQSIPKGQKEAAKVLGFTTNQTFFKITLPQMVKRVLPPMGSEFMTLVKDSALVQVIGVPEIYQLASNTVSSTASIIPLVMAGVFYLVMNAVVSKIFSSVEKRLDYYK